MRLASFLVHQLVLLLFRVVTIEVGHIHVLLLTLEYSMPVSSPVAAGLTRRLMPKLTMPVPFAGVFHILPPKASLMGVS